MKHKTHRWFEMALLITTWLAWFSFLFSTGLAWALEPSQFLAGFATVEITPPVGWRRAGGFSEFISTGVHDPLFAKALVLSQGTNLVALVGNDLCSVPRELTDRARHEAAATTGIPFANIIIAATHTHGGPESASPFRNTLVISLANDLDFYLPTQRAFEEGHYEPTTCPLEPGCGERLVEAAVKLLNEIKR